MNQGISTQAFSAPLFFRNITPVCYLKQVCVFKILRAYSNLAIWVSRAFKDSIIVSKWQKINISYEFHQRVIAQRHKKCAAYFIQQWIILSIEQHSLALIITKQDKKKIHQRLKSEKHSPRRFQTGTLNGICKVTPGCLPSVKDSQRREKASYLRPANKRWKLVWGGKTASGRRVRFFSLFKIFSGSAASWSRLSTVDVKTAVLV